MVLLKNTTRGTAHLTRFLYTLPKYPRPLTRPAPFSVQPANLCPYYSMPSMLRSPNVAHYFTPRRRARPATYCLIIVLVVSITLLRGRSSSYIARYEEAIANQRLFDYLSPVASWSRERLVHRKEQQLLQAERPQTDKIPEIPPTLLVDDDDLDGLESGSDTAPGLPSHTYDKNGLLTVNPNAPHPIYELVRNARAEWRTKLRRASRTLEEAVVEYKRRYNRLPPKGFDKWWEYVQKHDVLLPDEYDSIYHDLQPYWGIDPEDLQAAQAEREGVPDSFTIGKLTENSVVTLLNMTVAESRKDSVKGYMTWGVRPQLDLLSEVYKHIPPFRAAISPSDNPSLLADWTWRKAALDAAEKGTYIRPSDLPPQTGSGWSGACPPDSPLYLNPPRKDEEPVPQTRKTFIHDHRASMDPCHHPQHTLMHGTFLAHGIGPRPHRFPPPLFSYSATSLHSDIRATSMAQTADFILEDPRWEDKDDDRLFWRGTPTGMWHHRHANWKASHRIRLVNITGTTEPSAKGVVTFLEANIGPDEPVGDGSRHVRRKANAALMDVSFSGPVIGCEKDEVCDTMRSDLSWGNRVSSKAGGAGRYKFVLDVDGNGWSSRFRRLVSSNALVFKSTLFPEWWHDRAQAWVHYVPIQLDYSDLYDSVVFFGGNLLGEGAHEEMAYEIAIAGRQWARRLWRREDVVAYMFRLWLEYARLMSSDRDVMSFRLPQQRLDA